MRKATTGTVTSGTVTSGKATAATAATTVAAVGALAVLAACMPAPPEAGRADGAALYADYCAACHGPAGRGDGPAAAGLSRRPADLSTLAARNAGRFPQVAVMAKVYGYSRGQGGGGGVMPEFGPLLDGPTVLVETAPGVMTPTPQRLVALAEHVAALGRPVR